jgi:hypothetical protein
MAWIYYFPTFSRNNFLWGGMVLKNEPRFVGGKTYEGGPIRGVKGKNVLEVRHPPEGVA